MTLAEIFACVDGWKRANGGDTGAPPTDEELSEMLKEHRFA